MAWCEAVLLYTRLVWCGMIGMFQTIYFYSLDVLEFHLNHLIRVNVTDHSPYYHPVIPSSNGSLDLSPTKITSSPSSPASPKWYCLYLIKARQKGGHGLFLGWGPNYDFKKPNPKIVPYRLIYSSLLQRNVQLCGRKTVCTCLVDFALKHKAHSGPFLVHKSRQTLVDPCAPLRNFRDPMTSTAVHLSALCSANNRLFPTVWNKVFYSVLS